MSLIDTINALILRRLRPPVRYTVTEDCFRLNDARYEWADLTGASVFQSADYVGTRLVLALTFRDQKPIIVTQSEVCWGDLLARLDKLGTMPVSRAWLVEMIAGGGGQTIALQLPTPK